MARYKALKKKKKKVTIDAVVRFTHKGKKVVATVARTSWSPQGMTYYWKTKSGRTISTPGIPEDAEVLADVREERMSRRTWELTESRYGRTMPREYYLPKPPPVPTKPPGTDLIIYSWETDDGKIRGVAFSGKAKKPVWDYRFRSEAERTKQIDRTVSNVMASNKIKADRKAKDKEEKAKLAAGVRVGDIFVSSWGYNQTNVNFFQVIASKGMSVTLRPVGQKVAKSSRGSDYVVPDSGKFIGPAIKKRIGAHGIKIDNVSRAYPWDGKPKYQTASGWGH